MVKPLCTSVQSLFDYKRGKGGNMLPWGKHVTMRKTCHHVENMSPWGNHHTFSVVWTYICSCIKHNNCLWFCGWLGGGGGGFCGGGFCGGSFGRRWFLGSWKKKVLINSAFRTLLAMKLEFNFLCRLRTETCLIELSWYFGLQIQLLVSNEISQFCLEKTYCGSLFTWCSSLGGGSLSGGFLGSRCFSGGFLWGNWLVNCLIGGLIRAEKCFRM